MESPEIVRDIRTPFDFIDGEIEAQGRKGLVHLSQVGEMS